MSSVVLPQWQEKTNSFLSNSGVKLNEARQSAGKVAKDAKENMVDAAGRVGSMFKSKWSLFQQPSTKHAMQERLLSAAASTSLLLRKGYSETKDKVVVGKTKFDEVAKKTAQKSKTLMSDIERWQKGVASTDVFGVPIEITVQRQQSSRPIPQTLVRCADYLISSGLNSLYLFKLEGEKKVIRQLVWLYNQDTNALVPEGTDPVDIAALVKCYLASLPEPLIIFELCSEIRGARSNIYAMRNILKRLPTVNYMTLEFVTALLLRVSQKSLLNKSVVLNLDKMDARTLSEEIAPVLIWEKGQRPEYYKQFWHFQARSPSKKNLDPTPSYSEFDMLDDGDVDASSPIPLDDGLPVDFGAIEVVQCLIEHHNVIFTDANEATWR